MRKIVIKIVVLLFVFIAGVAGTSLLMNGEMTSDTAEMENASFPQVMVEIGDLCRSYVWLCGKNAGGFHQGQSDSHGYIKGDYPGDQPVFL